VNSPLDLALGYNGLGRLTREREQRGSIGSLRTTTWAVSPIARRIAVDGSGAAVVLLCGLVGVLPLAAGSTVYRSVA
jgi:hypothetical protein